MMTAASPIGEQRQYNLTEGDLFRSARDLGEHSARIYHAEYGTFPQEHRGEFGDVDVGFWLHDARNLAHYVGMTVATRSQCKSLWDEAFWSTDTPLLADD